MLYIGDEQLLPIIGWFQGGYHLHPKLGVNFQPKKVTFLVEGLKFQTLGGFRQLNKDYNNNKPIF